MLIDYKKVNIYHKDGAPVLHDVDFHVDEGEFIYVIGRVGSGKSSLLKTSISRWISRVLRMPLSSTTTCAS